MKIHLKKPSIKGGFAQIEERAPGKPTTSQGSRDRGRSVGLADERLGYAYEPQKINDNSFALNNSYQYNPNYSVDYGQRNSVTGSKGANTTAIYPDKNRKKKVDSNNPITFYTTNTTGFGYKRGYTKG
jgi:hypothetical protein